MRMRSGAVRNLCLNTCVTWHSEMTGAFLHRLWIPLVVPLLLVVVGKARSESYVTLGVEGRGKKRVHIHAIYRMLKARG